MNDDPANPVAQLIAERHDSVARRAVEELQQSSIHELPDLVHRLAGKLGVFGFPAAGDAARQLMHDLADNVDDALVPERVAGIVALLDTRPGCLS